MTPQIVAIEWDKASVELKEMCPESGNAMMHRRGCEVRERERLFTPLGR